MHILIHTKTYTYVHTHTYVHTCTHRHNMCIYVHGCYNTSSHITLQVCSHKQKSIFQFLRSLLSFSGHSFASICKSGYDKF